MKRRMKAFLMAFVMIFTVVAAAIGDVTVFKADEEQLVLKVHYERADGDYTGWEDVWVWEEGGDGEGCVFEEVDGEMVATKVITPGVAKLVILSEKAAVTGKKKTLMKTSFWMLLSISQVHYICM